VSVGEDAGLVGRGRLAENVTHFARVLRIAGLPIGTDRVLLALNALECAGIASRVEFHAALRSCLVYRAEHLSLFDQAFDAYWRDPDVLGKLLRLRLPTTLPRIRANARAKSQRLASALAEGISSSSRQADARTESTAPVLAAALSWSDRERLRKIDFEGMTTAEWQAARRLLATLDPALPRQAARRWQQAAHGAISLRAAVRDMARHGGEFTTLSHRRRCLRRAPLVLLIDISGSMSRYSRMLLHFAQQLCAGEGAGDRRVHVFAFGTRLTHITRPLSAGDPDDAVAVVVRAVDDWAGGTRIASCLSEYNRRWLQQTGGTRATVVLATDGLDHAAFDVLAAEMQRLRLGSRRLLWLNPLLRYDQFEPRARGVSAMLPHVDQLLPMHDVASLEVLAQVLGAYTRRQLSSVSLRPSSVIQRRGIGAAGGNF